MNKVIDLVLLLNGNFIPLMIYSNNLPKLEKQLKAYISNSEDVLVQMDTCCFRSKALLGWYVREHIQNPADKVIEFLDKKLPDENAGDEWKNEY